jgi:hypothetical protein
MSRWTYLNLSRQPASYPNLDESGSSVEEDEGNECEGTICSQQKIEDAKVIPVHLPNDLMTADIETKALGAITFAFHRDRLCGHVDVDKDEHLTHKAKKQRT